MASHRDFMGGYWQSRTKRGWFKTAYCDVIRIEGKGPWKYWVQQLLWQSRLVNWYTIPDNVSGHNEIVAAPIRSYGPGNYICQVDGQYDVLLRSNCELFWWSCTSVVRNWCEGIQGRFDGSFIKSFGISGGNSTLFVCSRDLANYMLCYESFPTHTHALIDCFAPNVLIFAIVSNDCITCFIK